MVTTSLSETVHVGKLAHLRWIIAGLIFLATTINYIDRQTISVAAPVISREFNLTAQDYSWIVTSFLLAYSIMQVVAGKFIDLIGTKRGFSLAIVWWSVANMLHALGTGVVSLSVYRFLLGVGEAGNYPAALKAIAEWFPKSERSTAVGILNAGPGLGAIIAPPLVAWLILTVGWRLAFVVTGLIGLIWLIGWQRFYVKPEEHTGLTEAEARRGKGTEGMGEGENGRKRDKVKEISDFGFRIANLINFAIRNSQFAFRNSQFAIRNFLFSLSPAPPTPWLHFFRYKEVWGLMLSRFVCDGAFYFFVFWLPKYLSDERGFNIAQIGLFAWIPFLAADLGSLTGGWVGSSLIKRGATVNASRKTMIWVGAALVPAAFPALFVESAYTALFLIAVALFAIQIKSSALFTVPADLFGSQQVASVWGLSGAAGSFGGMLFTPVVGWLVDNISYAPVFVIVSAMHIVSALLVMMLIPRIEPLKGSAAIA